MIACSTDSDMTGEHHTLRAQEKLLARSALRLHSRR